MNISVFSKYWNILKKNYQDKTHNKEEMYTYYSIFKEYDEDTFKRAVKETLKHQKYFPRIDEIHQYILVEDIVPDWMDKELERVPLTEEEKKDIEAMLNEIDNLH